MPRGASPRYPDAQPAGVSAATLLEDARRHIMRCRMLHGLADRLLPFCIEVMDLVPSADMARSWDNHNSNVLRSSDAAQMRPCDAASLAKAAKDAVDLAAALPDGDIIQSAWLVVVEQIQTKAIDEAYGARNRVWEMQDTLPLQFFDA